MIIEVYKVICADCQRPFYELDQALEACPHCSAPIAANQLDKVVLEYPVLLLSRTGLVQLGSPIVRSATPPPVSLVETEDGFEEDDGPIGRKFRWRDRLGCVEAIAAECADNGRKYDAALRAVRLAEYAYHVTKMPVKQKTLLKKDALERAKEIESMRAAADIGDVVRVPKLDENPLLGGYVRTGRKLVEAVIVSKYLVSSTYRYSVKRLDDGQVQSGNAHMIKSIVRRADGGVYEAK